jgi:acyl carrier protein
MQQAENLEALIIDFIRQEILGTPEIDIDLDENLFTGGQIDSLGIMRLIAHLERSLEVKIPPTELVPDNFRTVRVMSNYLQQLTAP